MIIRDAFDGLSRFGEFQKSLGLAKNILSARLRTLTARGILAVEPAAEGSAYQRYVLTEKGRGLFLVMVALRQWGEASFYAPGEPHSTMRDAETGEEVRRLALYSAGGRPLRTQDVVVRKV
ncbi:helix-turn-helix transcriptional regulator [Phreatobacter stygius]|uniref:Helix-turn-helix transcriptional regulator n=2 Tax=Phreatobacter stygius TaxID=1940610 RepID=A0A4D7BK94_9HYPH|nr:helix-turn-helix domain-containing protein [Phreatobacter stygius]QCI69416.1 helix-turn-helix transcriptional regulator [Phreatobacter stygius]